VEGAGSRVGMSEAELGSRPCTGGGDDEDADGGGGSDVSIEDDDDNDDVIAPRFLVLDFSRVTGMDSTAISTGLLRVKQIAMMHDIFVVFVGVRPDFQRLLITNGIVGDIREDGEFFLCV
jgi:hypothetical protein